LTRKELFLIFGYDFVLLERVLGDRCRSRDHRPPVKGFRYALDPICLVACALYALNRWLIGPAYSWPFLRDYFDDLLLVPAALPLILGVQRWWGLRSHDRPPTAAEILAHLVVWSLIAELLGPSFFPWVVGDPADVAAYALGAALAGTWWNRLGFRKLINAAVQPSPVARFDHLARHYDWMELLLAGGKLEDCRNALWNDIPPVKSALLVGEGHGKFLAALLRRYPAATVTCVDASEQMLKVARNRLEHEPISLQRVEFIHAALPSWHPPSQGYDLIATHFFLDCFPREQLGAVIDALQRALRPGACWLVSDFQVPRAGLRRLRAQVIHRLMYAFFRVVTKLPASCLVSPRPFFRKHGFVRVRHQEFDWGLLTAELWRRTEPSPSSSVNLPISAVSATSGSP
jgi:ubiquinone/menaquinone biosynthesis C-methylase UbiE